jgi:hypothetical protein
MQEGLTCDVFWQSQILRPEAFQKIIQIPASGNTLSWSKVSYSYDDVSISKYTASICKMIKEKLFIKKKGKKAERPNLRQAQHSWILLQVEEKNISCDSSVGYWLDCQLDVRGFIVRFSAGVQCKFAPVQAIKTYMRGRCKLFILNFTAAWRWMVIIKPLARTAGYNSDTPRTTGWWTS